MSSRLLDINGNDADHDVGTLLPMLCEPDPSNWEVTPKETSADMNTIGKAQRPASPVVNVPTHGSSNGSVDDDASHMTSITIELRKAAKKTIQHAKNKKQIAAAIPPHVQQSRLEKEFPHIRGNSKIKLRASARSVDSMKAELSVDSSCWTAGCSTDQEVEEERAPKVDCNDCVGTLSDAEISHLRNAMQSYEKNRVMTMMEHLSNQMHAFHELLEENEALKDEINQVKKEKESKVSELEQNLIDMEQTLIDMKLNLALCQSREDHTRLTMAKLEMDLKKSNDENQTLKQKLGGPEEQLKAERRNSRLLTKSLSSAELPDNNVRSGEPMKRKNRLLTSSWFGKEGLNNFLDRSNPRGDDPRKGVDDSFSDKVLMSAIEHPAKSPEGRGSPTKGKSPPRRPRKIHARSQSFIDPKKARALKESEFMHWNSDKSDDEAAKANPVKATGGQPKGASRKATRSQSFVEPNEARRRQEHIGRDVILPRFERNGDETFGSRTTILSNITDITYEDGDSLAEEIANALRKGSLPQKPEDKIPHSSSHGSRSAPTFEPAEPQLQQAMSLRESQQKVPALHLSLRKVKKEQLQNEMTRSFREVKREQPQNEMTRSFWEVRPNRPELPRAASLRGHKGKLSAGDDFLAFC